MDPYDYCEKLDIDRMNNLPKELISSIKDYVINDKVLKNLLLLNIELKSVIPRRYTFIKNKRYLFTYHDKQIQGIEERNSCYIISKFHTYEWGETYVEDYEFYRVQQNTIMRTLYDNDMYLYDLKHLARENKIKGRSKLKTRQDYKNAFLKL